MNFNETILIGYLITTVYVTISFFYIKALSTFFLEVIKTELPYVQPFCSSTFSAKGLCATPYNILKGISFKISLMMLTPSGTNVH